MSNSATISADIISYTALTVDDRRLLDGKIRELLPLLESQFEGDGIFSRIVKGDYIECAMANPTKSLRIALLIKTCLKSFELQSAYSSNRIKYFKTYGARVAIGVAPLTLLDRTSGIIDGEAIYLSGRMLQNQSTSGKEKIVIKNTLFFSSNSAGQNDLFEAMFSLIDSLIAGCSARQCEVVYHKLLGKNEDEIAMLTGKTQSTINQHSTAAGWNAIEKAIAYYEKYI